MLLLGDEGVPQDRSAALALFLDACKQGHAPSCVAILSAPDMARDHEVAEQILRPLCLEGDLKACRHAVRGLPSTKASALELCEAGVPYACGIYARRIDLGTDDKAPLPEERALLEKWQAIGCKKGDPEVCERAARNDPKHPMFKRATELRKAGCDAGYVSDCRGKPRDPVALVPQCLAGDADACVDAVASDRRTQGKVQATRCALDAHRCGGVARWSLRFNDVEGIVGARRAYEMGCSAVWIGPERRAADCLEAARAFELKPAEPAMAARLRAQACKLSPPACTATK